MEESKQNLLETLRNHLETNQPDQLRSLCAEQEGVEIASIFHMLTLEEQLVVLERMEADQALDVLNNLSESYLDNLLQEIPLDSLLHYFKKAEPDDAAYMISLMDPERGLDVLNGMAPLAREEVKVLLSYAEGTAGRIMDPDVVRVRQSQTVEAAINHIRYYVERVGMDDFFSVFVVDSHGHLAGEIPTWKMLLADPQQLIGDIMNPDVVAVEAELGQEEVAHMVQDHDLVTLAVVDKHKQLIGRITVDDVVDVIGEEHAEDIGRLAGTGSEEILTISIWESLRVRTPWLLFALSGLFISAMILNHYIALISVLPRLAFFVPLVMAMGGNFGIQSSSLVIRGLATGEVQLQDYWTRMGKELLVSINIGLLVALILVVGIQILTGSHQIALVVGFSTFSAVGVSAIIGISIPMGLKRLGFDPAMATGPFLTTLNDILGIVVYLSITHLLLF
ncbi:MAG: magnesium transporter [Deltaproteobacteria bacterium]|nr:magnesium transporter [Deltaproteobacteria bacterium]